MALSFLFHDFMPLKLKNIVNNINEIPSPWIFKFYSGIKEDLIGQTVILKSPKKLNQKTGSLRIFYSSGQYHFKDHFTGEFGGSLKFVAYIKNIPLNHAASLIYDDYFKYGDSFKSSDIIETPHLFEIIEINFRGFNRDDQEYWSEYYIKKRTLEYFNVKAIYSVKIRSGLKTFMLGGPRIYAYCDNFDKIYKIYKPNRDVKFLEFFHHFEGIDQIKNNDSIIIQSSLKDIMSFYELNLFYDSITPSGESRFLPSHMIYYLNEKYKHKYVMLDNDNTGLTMSNLYLPHGYKQINLNLKKDVSQSIKHLGQKTVRDEFLKLILL